MSQSPAETHSLNNNSGLTSKISSKEMIQSIVNALAPFDEIEALHQKEVLAWIETDAPLFRLEKPDVPEKHLVSYCVVLDKELNKILLVDHKKAQRWLPPGGHLKYDENPLMAAKRELKEELGLSLEPMQTLPFFLSITKTTGNTAEHTDVTLWYLFFMDSRLPIEFNPDEFQTIRWFSFEELVSIESDPHIERFKVKFLTLVK